MVYFSLLTLETRRYDDLGKNAGHATNITPNKNLGTRPPVWEFHTFIRKKTSSQYSHQIDQTTPQPSNFAVSFLSRQSPQFHFQ